MHPRAGNSVPRVTGPVSETAIHACCEQRQYSPKAPRRLGLMHDHRMYVATTATSVMERDGRKTIKEQSTSAKESACLSGMFDGLCQHDAANRRVGGDRRLPQTTSFSQGEAQTTERERRCRGRSSCRRVRHSSAATSSRSLDSGHTCACITPRNLPRPSRSRIVFQATQGDPTLLSISMQRRYDVIVFFWRNPTTLAHVLRLAPGGSRGVVE